MVRPSASAAFMMAEILHPAWTLTVMFSASSSRMPAMSDMSTRKSPSVWVPFLLRGDTEAPPSMMAETALQSSSLLEGLST